MQQQQLRRIGFARFTVEDNHVVDRDMTVKRCHEPPPG
ncbi:hypothetical protein E9232_003981 [Inquilinus ginsengisoli]|uniref:Uncharacterized protein n=1 Tax=Inquilinus ginsengisoli TaxID=363840 RepID=A0ABU1JT46_9PROT|nr:hypothetical protein [Inquilinus ginsengisoli]